MAARLAWMALVSIVTSYFSMTISMDAPKNSGMEVWWMMVSIATGMGAVMFCVALVVSWMEKD